MSLFGNNARSTTKNIVEFRAGKMHLKGTTVTPDKRKGQVYAYQAEDSLMHLCWKDRTSGTLEDDLIIFPDDCELKRVPQCTTGRVYLLRFKISNKKMFFWMQEPKSDKDEEFCKKVNDALNNPPQPGQGQPSAADLGGLEALAQGANLQDLFNNMDQQQLLQLMAGGGLGNLLGQGGTRSRSRNTGASATRTPTSTTATPQRTTAAAAATPAPTTTTTTTTSTTPSNNQSTVQLSQLQDILSQMGASKPKETINLADAITPEAMIPILADPKIQERLKPFLPQGETLTSTEDELRSTAHSPHFRQAMSSFSSALASGQLGSLLAQFGLPEAAQTAANKGDVEAFAKAMQDEAKKPPSKDEHMSVD